MTTEAQRIAIAEACGQIVTQHELFTPEQWKNWCNDVKHLIPDYLSDLNAMHEAEKVLTDEQKRLYVILLLHGGTEQGEVMGAWHCLHATAAQRAEVLLRTIGKWEE